MSDSAELPPRSLPPSFSDSARILGVDVSTLYRAKDQGWDCYPETFVRWQQSRRGERKKPGPKPQRKQLDDSPEGLAMHVQERHWAVLFRRAKAQREQLQLEMLQGSLVPRADVVRLFVSRVSAVRSALVALPRTVVGRLDLPPELAALVEREFEAELRALLGEFAREHPLIADDTAHSSDA